MNKVQISLFLLIILLFGIMFYVTQGDQLGLTGEPKNQVSISQIPGEITLVPTRESSAQTQQDNQSIQVVNRKVLEEFKTASSTAILETSKGTIKLLLYGEEAPYTVANFIMKASGGYYNNLTFHRVEDWVIQGGDPKGNGTGGGYIQTEINDKPFVVGSLGVARGGNIQVSNDSQFFITKSDSSHLNNQYTNFGIVTEGMEVVEKMAIGDKILKITIE